MFDSFSRRQFIVSTVGATIALEWLNSLAVAIGADLGELLSHVDPLLRPPATALPDSQNAFSLIDSASKLLSELPDGEFELEDCFSDKPDVERDRLISAWLDENQRAMGIAEQAISRGKLEFPNTPWVNERLDSGSRFRNLSRFLQLWAQRLASQGKLDDAARISGIMSNSARLLKDGGGVYVEYLIACACEGDSWNLMRRIGQSVKTPPNTIRRMLTELPGRQVSSIGLRSAIRSEYCHYLLPELLKGDGLETKRAVEVFFDWSEGLELFLPRKKYEARCDKIARMLEGHPKAFDLIETVKLSSAHHAGLIHDCELPWAKLKLQPDRMPSEELTAWPKQLSISVLDEVDPDEVTASQLAASRQKLMRIANPLGKKIVDSCQLDSKTMRRAALSNQARYDGTRLFLAVCIFVREQGKFPASLDDLIEARILESVPLDPFSSERFHYSRDQHAIWSVGWDGQVSPKVAADGEYDLENHLWRLDAIESQK